MQTRANKSGISIIETIVALMIISMIGASLLLLNVQIQSATNSANFKSFAESQAQKLIEQTRSTKNLEGGTNSLVPGCYDDGSLDSGRSSASCSCLTTGGTIQGKVLPSPNQQFKQYVNIIDASGGKRVEAVVGWVEKQKNNCTKIITILYDY